MGDGNAVHITYLDFKKAFGKVPHDFLVNRFEKYGLEKNTTRWINSWLNSFKQRIKRNKWIYIQMPGSFEYSPIGVYPGPSAAQCIY